MEIGSLAWLAVDPAVPTVSSAAEFVVPASNSRPLTRTPLTSAICMVFTPFCGISVGNPMPRIVVSAWVTLSVWLMLYTPGVKNRLQPSDSAVLMVAALIDGSATKNWLIGTEVPGVGPLAQLGPEAFVRSEGRNTW